MACNKPIPAWQYDGGLHFKPKKSGDHQNVEVACGKCLQCRLDNARSRTIRLLNEKQMHEESIFVTLTIDEENMWLGKNLNYDYFKKFMKRLRYYKKENQIKYYACGEYGGDLKNKNNVWLWDRRKYNYENLPKYPRAHFHAIIFGYEPEDGEVLYMNKQNQPVYVSKELNKIWKLGHTSYGTVTDWSCGYVARYIMKKQNSVEGADWIAKYGQPLYDLETGEYINHHPIIREMAFGSSRPAIGQTWIEKYWKTDCFNNGFILGPAPDHKKYSIPRYYWEWLEANHREDFKVYKKARDDRYLLKKDKIEADNTPERRDSKELILKQKVKTLTRGL